MAPMNPPKTPPARSGPGPLVLLTGLAIGLAAVLAALLLLAPNAGGVGPPDAGEASGVTSREHALDRARAAADALTRDLKTTLTAEMSAGGPGAAIRVCSEVAQEIAAEHSTDGLTVRRVSRKARNPADRPDLFEADQLGRLAELHARGELPKEVIEVIEVVGAGDGDRTLRYLRPITVQPLCLRCHGDPEDFTPEVRRVLAERYPDDEATGYGAGDLRGAVSVTVPYTLGASPETTINGAR
jgi:hypothetical protein